MRKIFMTFIAVVASTVFATAQNVSDAFSYRVGECEIHLISETQGNGNKGILVGVTDDMLAGYAPDGTFPNATNAFLIKGNGKNILIDAGYGRLLFEKIEALGVPADKVDIVLLTHMHGDHIGGMMRDDNIAFPNAEVYLSQREHDYWMSDVSRGNASQKDVIEKYKAKLHIFDPQQLTAPDAAFLPGITAIAAYGHTPGHTAFLLNSGGQKLMVWGDLAHGMVIQIPYPQISATYDVDPEVAAISRIAIMQFVSDYKIPVMGSHIAYPGGGRLAKDDFPANPSFEYTPF